jgi:dehydrogenase/reductase SDR family protein 12
MIASLFSSLAGPLLDATVVLSFDRTGYRVHALGFDEADLDVDLTGKVCAVTGANAGLGEAIATALAARGARVWLLCRDAGRAEAASQRIREAVPGASVHTALADLASCASVREFAASFPEPRLDVLVHNAGILPAERADSPDGIELTFATNVVGPFLMTHLLRARLEDAPQGRIVTVSSGGMYPQRLDLDDWSWSRRPFDGVAAYALTKRAEVVLSEMWAERQAGTRVTSNAMHPGWADTPGVERSIPRFHHWMRGRLRTPAEGADTAVWLAAAPRLASTSGKFFFDRAERRTHWFPWTPETAESRRGLWTLCCRLAGIEE